MNKTLIALMLAAGLVSTSFAQGTTSAAATPAAVPAAKVAVPAAADKKVEAPKAVEPVKAEAVRTAQPTMAAAGTATGQEHAAKPPKQAKMKVDKPDTKTDTKTEAKAASKTEAPVTK